MAREVITIVNARGLHARASAKFVNAVAKLPEELIIKVSKDGFEANGSSIMGLMMLGAAKGDRIEIAVTGADAQGVLLKLAGLVKDGFGED
ncbi:HPr family phosphocarrier protein [Novosphingobium sp. Chol11]|uniref:HPr family phosphocarrier protein n=1 Tax=Novosphingobium sp. Chol11 TaxID=1385763 RepID=UPI0025D5A099|nr:HPr family phosphocarrier protein [Novosphingobium sp. Chol11]